MTHPFDDPLQRLERLLKDADGRFGEVYGPLVVLKMAITIAAYDTQRDLGPAFGFTTQGRPTEPQMLLQCELLYFFSHLALRSVVAEGLTETQAKKLQAFLGPWIAWTAVNAFCMHWPEHLKRKMTDEAYHKLNDAEMDYAECRGLVEPKDPLNANTLIGRLAANAMALWGRAADDPAAFAVAAATQKAVAAMRLNELARDVARVIDLVDVEWIEDFWRQSGGA